MAEKVQTTDGAARTSPQTLTLGARLLRPSRVVRRHLLSASGAKSLPAWVVSRSGHLARNYVGFRVRY